MVDAWRALYIRGQLHRIDLEPGAALAALKLTQAKAAIIYRIDPDNPVQAIATDWQMIVRAGRRYPAGGAVESIQNSDWPPGPVELT